VLCFVLGALISDVSSAKTMIFWTAFNPAESTQTVYNALAMHNSSVTHVGVISYVCNLAGEFDCMCDPSISAEDCQERMSTPRFVNGVQITNYSDCPYWDQKNAYINNTLGIRLHPMISLPPGYKADGLNKLWQSSSLQQTFINDAVSLAQQRGFDGYNVDWENLGSGSMTDFGSFLTKFANALHQLNPPRKLSVDVSGVGALKSTTIDWFCDMSTYTTSDSGAINEMKSQVSTLGGPGRYAFGFDAEEGYSESSYSNRFNAMDASGVTAGHLWEDRISDVGSGFWTGSAKWLAS